MVRGRVKETQKTRKQRATTPRKKRRERRSLMPCVGPTGGGVYTRKTPSITQRMWQHVAARGWSLKADTSDPMAVARKPRYAVILARPGRTEADCKTAEERRLLTHKQHVGVGPCVARTAPPICGGRPPVVGGREKTYQSPGKSIGRRQWCALEKG